MLDRNTTKHLSESGLSQKFGSVGLKPLDNLGSDAKG